MNRACIAYITSEANRATITVTNSAVAATSLIFLQVESVNAVTAAPSLIWSAVPGAGSFTINVLNTDPANATAAAPIYHYFIVN